VNGNGQVTADFVPNQSNLGVSISPSSATIQLGNSVQFTASASRGSGTYSQYVWYWMEYGTAKQGSYSSGSSNTYAFTPSETGSYGVYVVVTDSSGNAAQSLSSSVTVQSTPPPSTGNLQILVYDEQTGSPIQSASVRMVSAPSGQSLLSGITDSSGQHTFQNVQTGSYAVQVTASGYSSGTGSATVQSGQTAEVTILLGRGSPPQAAFTWTPLQAYEGMTVTFDASSSSAEGATITQYEWTINDPNNPVHTIQSSPTIAHAFSTSGTYVVQLNVTNSVGLWSTTSRPVVVAARAPCQSPYDIDGDHNPHGTDINDVAVAAKAFGSSLSNPEGRWNPKADVYGPNGVPDGKVDLSDIAMIAKNFGRPECPASSSTTGQSATPQAQSDPPYVSVDGGYVLGPGSVIGQTFDVTVSLNHVTEASQHLIATEFRLCYDNTLIVPINVAVGPNFPYWASLEPGSLGTFFASFFDADGLGPNVLVGLMVYPDASGVWHELLPDGTGVIVTITFQVIAQPSSTESITTPLTLADVYAIGLDNIASQNLGFVSLGPSVNGNVTITASATHTVFFEESGVGNPAQVWSVALDGYGTEYSNGPGNTIYTIAFNGVANGGPYQFVVTPPSGFVAQPTADPITVNGGDFNQSIIFNQAPVTYTFTLAVGSGGSVSYSFSLGSGTVLSGQSQQLTVPPSCQIHMTANPDSLHIFQTWSTTGSVSVSDPSSASTTATVNGNGGVTANFAYNLGVSISPTSKSIQSGESATLTATPSGGSGGYKYVWYWMEYGTANHDSYNSGSSSTYIFTRTEAGNYGVYVVVTDSSGKTAQSLNSSVAVTDFQLIVTPQSLTIPLTENAIFTVQEIPINGFINSVTLAHSNVPTGVFCDFAPSTIAPSQTSKASLTVTENAQVGSYSITITGTSGALTHQVTVKIDLTRTVGLLNILSFSHLNPESQLNHLGFFSIQQNFEVIVPSSSIPFVYWVQNVIIITYIAGWRAAVATEVWNFTETPPTEVPGTHRNSLPKYGISIPVTFNIASVISGNDLILSNDFESWTWSLPTGDGQQPAAAFIVNYDTTTRTINTGSPEFVVVGDMNKHQAIFLDQTDGSVTSMCLLMGQSWTKCLSQEIATPGNTATKETSLGLQWDKTGVCEVKFHAVPGSKQEGIKFVPVESSTLHDSATMMDQTSLTGVSVSITGSSAPDGTSVTIATTKLGGVSTDVIQVGTSPAAYYDVNVQGISDGTATVCITNSGLLGQTTMQYWNGAQWVMATDVVVSGNTICGNIPVSALTGTPIAIGPIQPHDVGVIDVTPYRNWAYQGLSINISVTTTNFGAFTENETLNLFYTGVGGAGMIASEIVVLAPNQTEISVFSWNTTGVPPSYSGYNMTASADISPEIDSNMTNNVLQSPLTVEIRILGDVNDDGKVDISDVATAAKAFGSHPGYLRWNPIADINLDGKVDILDIALIAKNFGKHYP
jgi:hypothetical protein